MPVITSVKPQKNHSRVNIYLDGKFGFGIDLNNFVKLQLKVGQSLSEKDIAEIVKKSEFQKTLDKLLKFMSLRPRSEKEIQDYFNRKKIHLSLQSGLFSRLVKLDLVNDEKFAAWWIEQRQHFRPKPQMVLKKELIHKGISREILDKVFSQLDIDEVKIARQLLDKRKYRWQGLAKVEAKRKMSEFLSRKGFSWEVIKKVVNSAEDNY